jgi:hypothetical protein
MKTRQAMPSAVLSPHPDDAVLSCWHLLTHPDDVIVLNVFTAAPNGGGDPTGAWWDRLTGATSSEVRMRDRLAEDADALRLAERMAVNLGFLDAQYRTAEQSIDAVADKLATVLDTGMRIYAPAALGAVPDHEVVLAAALMMEQHGHEVAFYADLPHAIRFGWPASVTGLPPDPALDVDAYWESLLTRSVPAAGALATEIHALDDRALMAKLAAVRTYRTQLPGLIALNPRLAEPRSLGYEAVWRR